MNRVFGRIRRRTLSGVLVLVPLFVTLVVLRAIFSFTAGILLPIIEPAVNEWPGFVRSALSVGILLIFVYVLGEVAAHVLGRRVLSAVDAVLVRVPVIRVIYRASQQVVSAFGASEGPAFKSVVLVEFPHPGMKSVGFVTSVLKGPGESSSQAVFVPTSPNPTSGFLQIMPAEMVTPTDLSVEEAFQMLMSMGALTPTRLTDRGPVWTDVTP